MTINTIVQARDQLILSLSNDRAAVITRNSELAELLRDGFTGYANMTHEELKELAVDAGLGDNDDPEDGEAIDMISRMLAGET